MGNLSKESTCILMDLVCLGAPLAAITDTGTPAMCKLARTCLLTCKQVGYGIQLYTSEDMVTKEPAFEDQLYAPSMVPWYIGHFCY